MSDMKRPVPKQTAQFLKRVFAASGKRHLLLTGSRQSGKTTLLGELVCGEPLPGLQSRAVFGGAAHPERVELQNRITGEIAVAGRFCGGAMQVQPEAFEQLGASCLKAAAAAPGSWVQIDELGFLERDCAVFADAVTELFAQKRVLAVLRKQPGIVLNDALLSREDVFVFDLDRLAAPGGLQIGCAILAAGRARRFGSNKLLAEFRGRPLIEQTFLRLPPCLWGSTLVVTRHQEIEDLAAEYGLPAAAPDGEDISGSIRCAAKRLRTLDGVLFSVGDQPLCRTESLEQMLTVFAETPKVVVRLSFAGRQGNPVLFPQGLLPELEKLKKGQSGTAVLRQHPEKLCCVPAALEEELADADTPQELAALRLQ